MKRKLKKLGKFILVFFLILIVFAGVGWFFRVPMGRSVFNWVLSKTSRYDLLHYDVYARTNSEKKTISIQTVIKLKSNVNGLKKVLLFLTGDFHIEAISKKKPLHYRSFKIPIPAAKIQALIITLDKSMQKNENYTFSISYSGKPAGDCFINKEGAELNAGVPWLPFSLDDKFTSTQIITVPKNQIVVANGEFIRAKEAKNTKTFIWNAPFKTWTNSFSSYNFKTDSKKCNNIRVQGYFSNDHDYKQHGKMLIDEICFALNLYSQHFGHYAFKNFYFVQTPRDERGSNYGGSGIIMIPRENFKHYFKKSRNPEKLFYILFHEIAHNWFGSVVDSKIVQSRWLEMLAETSMILAFEKRFGRAATQERIIISFLDYLDYTQKGETSLNDLFFMYTGRIVYDKGLMVFRMLRYILGDELFMKVMKEFYASYKFKQTVWQDFKDTVEKVSGKNLDWFFNAWFLTTKKLDFELYDVHLDKKGSGDFLTRFTARNAGDIEMPVPVEVLLDYGREKELKKIKIEKKETTYSFSSKHQVKNIILDPNYWFLDINRYNDTSPSRAKFGAIFDLLGDDDVEKLKLRNERTWVYVKRVEKNSVAEKYGLRENDIATKINGKEVRHEFMLRYELWNMHVGDEINIDILRNNKETKLRVML